MAIKLLNTQKLPSGYYSVTVQDDSYITGVDELGADTYWQTSVTYNPNNGKENLKLIIEDAIRERKIVKTESDAIVLDIKTTVESIDVSKIAEVK